MFQLAKSFLGCSLLASIATPQPLDRLGLLSLLMSLYFLQIWGFSLIDSSLWPASYHANLILVGLSMIGILLPRFFLILVLNCSFYIAHYIIESPIASNNQTTAFFVSLVILFGSAIFLINDTKNYKINRDNIFLMISNPGKFILAGMYFYGIYHKINWDFLNPQVSCAIELYRPLAVDFDLHDWSIGHYAAIYGTFIVEGVAMILLFSSRYKLLGIIVGIPFHIAIGWTGYGYYKDFSTIVLVMYAMFLPRVMLERAYASASRILGGGTRALYLGRTGLFAALFTHLIVAGVHADRTMLEPTHDRFVWFFTFYALSFYFVAITFVPWNSADGEKATWNRWLAFLCIFPLAYFINGASPYLGLKTESSIAMFSNLHTEGGQTNHLLHGALPIGFDFQTDLVYPISSNSMRFESKYIQPYKRGSNTQKIGEDLAIVRYELDRMLDADPNLKVTFKYDGEIINSWENWDNNHSEYSWIARKFLIFKSPVDFNRPKVCSH